MSNTRDTIKTELQEELQEELGKLSNNSIILLDAHAENCFDAVMESTNFMLDQGKAGIYVTVSKPYKFITRKMQDMDMKLDNLLFIDCISLMAGDGTGKGCIFVETPALLQHIRMNIDSLISKPDSREKFLIIDSISMFLIYNEENKVKEFVRFLVNKLKQEKVTGVFITINNEISGDLKRVLTKMCDEVIHV